MQNREASASFQADLLMKMCLLIVGMLFVVSQNARVGNADELPVGDERIARWLEPQQGQRDTAGPIISLGPEDAFDDTHLFAPCVAFENDRYSLWYSGSQGDVAHRVFQLGMATSNDGKQFEKHRNSPVFSFGDGKHSVLTATLLRSGDGQVLRENGRLRLWFSTTHFAGNSGVHTLHQSTSADGIRWSPPAPSQLENVYAPTIVKHNGKYRMWYTDVSGNPWVIKHASSGDGVNWTVSDEPVVVIDQPWEQQRLFYPAVVHTDGVWLMWYGSYWSAHAHKTAIGFAVSRDGIRWHKHRQNPVFKPEPTRPWESHYTTSQSVMKLPDGSWRIWYASRKKPPFTNKYFAIGTARWSGPSR